MSMERLLTTQGSKSQTKVLEIMLKYEYKGTESDRNWYGSYLQVDFFQKKSGVNKYQALEAIRV